MTQDGLSLRLRFIDPGAISDDIETPEMASWLPERMAFVENLSARFKSLEWAAQKRPEVFGGALLTFSRRRFAAAGDTPALLPDQAWGSLALIPAADRVRLLLGGTWDPRAAPTSWPHQLFLGVDDIVEVFWFLRSGLTVPAALITRRLLERWSLNVAHHFSLTQADDESAESFLTRIWRTHGAVQDAGAWWAWLSELLHARPGDHTFDSEASRALSVVAMENVPHHESIARIAELLLRHLRGGLALLAENTGDSESMRSLTAVPREILVREKFPMSDAFIPLDYFETHCHRSEELVAVAKRYRATVTDDKWELTTRIDLRMTAEAFLERRGRAIESARGAFEVERRNLGDAFRPTDLAARMFRQSTIAEMAMQLATVTDGIERDALIVAGQAAEGATHLWLEDSDYSLGCLRVLLEQVARLRVHRVKPHRAARLEALGAPPASRWVSEAGWQRLAVLLRSFNEYAHSGWRSRQRGAGKLLYAIRRESPGGDTRRGSAVNSTFMLLAFELHDRLAEVSPAVATEFGRRITLVGDSFPICIAFETGTCHSIRDVGILHHEAVGVGHVPEVVRVSDVEFDGLPHRGQYGRTTHSP